MPRKPNTRCNLSWEDTHGTTASGNLPQYKATTPECGVDISSITYSEVQLSDFKFYHMKCPYSTEADSHYARITDKTDPNYFKMEDISTGPIGLASHTATNGIMIKESRGRRHGWVCVDDNCPFYTSTSSRFFYV